MIAPKQNLKIQYNPDGSSVFTKICPCCNEKFTPKNRKRKFCSNYCKHVWHYEAAKLEFANDKLLEDGNKKNYYIIKDLDRRGIYFTSEYDLNLLGFDDKITPLYMMVENKMAAVYNCYALHEENEFLKIIKFSPWQLSK
jgi:hypothetical protein